METKPTIIGWKPKGKKEALAIEGICGIGLLTNSPLHPKTTEYLKSINLELLNALTVPIYASPEKDERERVIKMVDNFLLNDTKGSAEFADALIQWKNESREGKKSIALTNLRCKKCNSLLNLMADKSHRCLTCNPYYCSLGLREE